MAKNIAYVHDISLNYDGGAEIATRTIIKTGRALGYNVGVFDDPMTDNPQTNDAHFGSLRNYDLIILSNIWRFWPIAMGMIMDAIRTVPYIKYQHDYDGLGGFPLYIDQYPRADYAEKIYGNAALNVFQSPDHKRAFEEDFGIEGICMPPMIEVDFFKADGVERRPDTALIGSPDKCRAEDIHNYIQQHPDIKFDVQQKVPHEQIPSIYSQYEYFVYLPHRKFPCDRVTFEAALCGCKVETNDNVESWGADLSDSGSLRRWLREIPYLFWSQVDKIIEGRTTH